MGIRVTIEDTAVVRSRPKTIRIVSQASTVHIKNPRLALPIVLIAPAQLKVAQPVQESHLFVFTRLPEVRVFRL